MESNVKVPNIRALFCGARSAFNTETNEQIFFKELKLYKNVYKSIVMEKIDYKVYKLTIEYYHLPTKVITFESRKKEPDNV